tara:strand:+ start:3356 stop:3889 length:534 start_codon:yes stop_codon:yes gene_type:complete
MCDPDHEPYARSMYEYLPHDDALLNSLLAPMRPEEDSVGLFKWWTKEQAERQVFPYEQDDETQLCGLLDKAESSRCSRWYRQKREDADDILYKYLTRLVVLKSAARGQNPPYWMSACYGGADEDGHEDVHEEPPAPPEPLAEPAANGHADASASESQSELETAPAAPAAKKAKTAKA